MNLDQAANALHGRICDTIQEFDPGKFVTRWVQVVEVIDADGNTAIWTMASEGMPMWDRIGMLEFASRLNNPEAMRG